MRPTPSGGGATVPAAPYPPMSSATSSSSSFSRYSSETSGYDQLPSGALVEASARESSTSAPSLTSASASPVTGGGKARRNVPSRVQFCPGLRHVYGAVNCLPPQGRQSAPTDAGAASSTLASAQPMIGAGGVRAKRAGPPLLEIRRLSLVTDPDLRRSVQFDSEPILVSRGNPALGTNVLSTCLSFRPEVVNTRSSDAASAAVDIDKRWCATGLTSGALCVHTLSNLTGAGSEGATSAVQYYAPPRHHRTATSVAWRSGDARHVAIGLVGGGGGGGPPGGGGGIVSGSGAYRKVGSRVGYGSGGEREFGCLVWDVEAQSSSASTGKGGAVKATVPVYRFAHGNGVASLAWLLEGKLLAVGCQMRNVQLYDVRTAGSNTPPASVFAHGDAVSGIEVDPHRPTVFATFSRGAGEPVKLWDARRMDSSMSEIRNSFLGGGNNADGGAIVSAATWSALYPGTLSVATGGTIRNFDTTAPGSRPVLTGVNYAPGVVQCIKLQALSGAKSAKSEPQTGAECLYPHRMLVVTGDGTVYNMSKFQVSPLAISRRDGRVANSLGRTVWIGPTSEGPSAMEGVAPPPEEDISATMMRRARCLHTERYSTDAAVNIQMLSSEILHRVRAHQKSDGAVGHPFGNLATTQELLSLWNWIIRVEYLSSERDDASNVYESIPWPARGLLDAGVLKLLKMDGQDAAEYQRLDVMHFSDSLGCNAYDSQLRRAALGSCGWIGKFDLRDVLTECEAQGHFERSAALAVWYGELGAAVAALQRGADAIRLKMVEAKDRSQQKERADAISPNYVETLQLVAMCVAGYNGSDSESKTSGVWRNACEGLLLRQDFSADSKVQSQVPYLRAICSFLLNIGREGGTDKVLYDESLSLLDRVAFACRFLPRTDLKTYLRACIKKCHDEGSLEGLMITGMDKEGVSLIQSYVDKYADVQTAALVSSRVIMPADWVEERAICSEWLDSYRDLLNTWQMWHSRAAFDVGRAELLRRLKGKQAEECAGATGRGGAIQYQGYQQGRRGSYAYNHAQGKRQVPSAFPNTRQSDAEPSHLDIPAQLCARCNYCNTTLSLSRLRRQEGIANSWLSRQKPVLSCCPQCKKPLPRCAICLLPLGCLNPYMELKRERNQSSRGGNGAQGVDDLSELANLPFAEWFTWCMRCKHGGHAHHLVGWFASHQTCAVSGCDCMCQFDGIQKLCRPAIDTPKESLSG